MSDDFLPNVRDENHGEREREKGDDTVDALQKIVQALVVIVKSQKINGTEKESERERE